MQMDLLSKLLKKMLSLGASDLFISSNTPPAFRVKGKLLPRNDENPLNAGQIEQMAQLILIDEQKEQFENNPELNVAISLPNIGRFRVNLFRQRNDTSMVIRAIPPQVPKLEDLHLPEVLKEIVMLKRGLILIVGATSSGKSTTLAAMLDYRNENDLSHIITIEDPIEYYLQHKQCVVNQREIGTDTKSYNEALLNTMRQSPDVLVIGEIRDRKTLEHALEYADTGHLCLATFHANDTTQAFERIITLFPEERREQLLISLSMNMRAVLSQRLVRTVDNMQVPAWELIRSTPRIKELIRKNDFSELKASIEKDVHLGMQSFDQTLYELCKEGKISEDTALENADSVNNLRLKLRLDKAAQY